MELLNGFEISIDTKRYDNFGGSYVYKIIDFEFTGNYKLVDSKCYIEIIHEIVKEVKEPYTETAKVQLPKKWWYFGCDRTINLPVTTAIIRTIKEQKTSWYASDSFNITEYRKFNVG